jgi:hypothetical protein
VHQWHLSQAPVRAILRPCILAQQQQHLSGQPNALSALHPCLDGCSPAFPLFRPRCRHVQCVKPDHALLSKARTAIEPVIGSFGAGVAANAGVHSSGSNSGGSSKVGPSSAAGTAAARLRRHFAELTVGLLAPFEVYFTPGPSGKVSRRSKGEQTRVFLPCTCAWACAALG